MRPQPFADLLKTWIRDADHPGIAGAQTCFEAGRWSQPCGVIVKQQDGWSMLIQLVRGSPPGGDTDGPPSLPTKEDYAANWAATEAEARKAKPSTRGTKPSMSMSEVLAVALDVIKRAEHEGVAEIEMSAKGGRRPCLRVFCADKSTIYGLPVGVIPPGSTDFSHPAHQIPDEIF